MLQKKWYRPLVWLVILSILFQYFAAVVPPRPAFAQEPVTPPTQQVKKVYLQGTVVPGAGAKWSEAFEAAQQGRNITAQEAAIEATRSLGGKVFTGTLATFVREEVVEVAVTPLAVPDPPPPPPGDPYTFDYYKNLIEDPLFEVPILDSPWFFQGGATLINDPPFCTGSQTRCAYLQAPWSSINSAWVNIPPSGMTLITLVFGQKGGEMIVKIHDGVGDSVWFVSDQTGNPDEIVETRMDFSVDLSGMNNQQMTLVVTYNSPVMDFSEWVEVDEVRWYTGMGQQRKVVVNAPVPVFTDPELSDPLVSKNTGNQYFLAGMGEEYPVINSLGIVAFYAQQPEDEWWSSGSSVQAKAAAATCPTPEMPFCVYLPLIVGGGGTPPPEFTITTPATGWFNTSDSTKVEFKDYEIRTTLTIGPGGDPLAWCDPINTYQLDPRWNGIGRAIEELKARGEEITVDAGQFWGETSCPLLKLQMGQRGPLSLLDGWICLYPAMPDITIRTDISPPSFWILDIYKQNGSTRFWQQFDVAAQNIEKEAAQREAIIQGAVVVGVVALVVTGGVVIVVMSPDHGIFTGPAYIAALSTSGALPREAEGMCVPIQEP